MRRKIPGRKHRGVRDPELQNAQRLEKLKNKINNPPANIDEQQIPKSVERLRILREKVKNGEFKKRKKSTKPPPMFQKLPHENNRQFMYRITKVCDTIRKEATFETKYGVNIKRNQQGEVIDVLKRAKDPVELMVEQARQEKKSKKKKKNSKSTEEGEKLTKSQKKQLKLKDKKQRKQLEKGADYAIESKLVDTVRFGEQAHAPPVLTIPKKAKKQDDTEETTRKPGQKNLLLKTMLGQQNVGENKPKTPNKIDRKGKRKDLPNSVRRQLEKQQQEVIEAYKAMKLKKKQDLT